MKKIIMCLIFFSLFVLFLILYLTNNINYFDELFYSLIIRLKSDGFTHFMKFITFFASTIFISIIMFFLLLLFFIKKKKLFLLVDVLILGEVILNNVLKLLIGRERPSLINLVVENSYSFPSGHTMVSIVFYGFLIYLINRSKLSIKLKYIYNFLLIFLIILIMLSRIYLGVHFASDVFSGACLAIAYLVFMISILERKKYL